VAENVKGVKVDRGLVPEFMNLGRAPALIVEAGLRDTDGTVSHRADAPQGLEGRCPSAHLPAMLMPGQKLHVYVTRSPSEGECLGVAELRYWRPGGDKLPRWAMSKRMRRWRGKWFGKWHGARDMSADGETSNETGRTVYSSRSD